MHLVRLERTVLDRIAVVAGLRQVPVGEGIAVDDEDPTRREIVEIRLQGGRVHGDEHVRRVARREDVVVGEMELEARDARKGARRGPDLRRKVRVRGEVVPEHGRLGGEPAAGQLHPVAGVPGEPDHDRIELLDGLRGHRRVLHPAERDLRQGLSLEHGFRLTAPHRARDPARRSCRAGSTRTSARG